MKKQSVHFFPPKITRQICIKETLTDDRQSITVSAHCWEGSKKSVKTELFRVFFFFLVDRRSSPGPDGH